MIRTEEVESCGVDSPQGLSLKTQKGDFDSVRGGG